MTHRKYCCTLLLFECASAPLKETLFVPSSILLSIYQSVRTSFRPSVSTSIPPSIMLENRRKWLLSFKKNHFIYHSYPLSSYLAWDRANRTWNRSHRAQDRALGNGHWAGESSVGIDLNILNNHRHTVNLSYCDEIRVYRLTQCLRLSPIQVTEPTVRCFGANIKPPKLLYISQRSLCIAV